MRALCLVVGAALAWGCSGRDASTEADGATPLSAESALNGGAYRCVVLAPTPVLPAAATVALVGAPWSTRGPDGARAYARVGSGDELHWRGARAEGDVPARLGLREGAFGWAGERFVAVLSERANRDDDLSEPEWRRHRVVSLDARHEDLTAVRAALPESACAPAVTEMAGRAMLTWHRRTADGCDAGSGWFQLLGARGEALGPAQPLTERDPDGRVVDVRVRELSARWDFGRAVLQAQRSDTGLDLAWIVDPAGEVLWTGPTGGAEGAVACPRGGCLRVRVADEVSANAAVGGKRLSFERLLGGGGFAVNAPVTDLVGVVVSGDRALTLHSPAEGSAGCDLVVVDLAARAVVAQHHADAVACDVRYVRATPRGFVVTSAEGAGGASRAIDCGW